MHQSSTKTSTVHFDFSNQSSQSTSTQQQLSTVPALSNQSTPVSCPAVDIEWPPRSSYSASSELSNGNKQLNVGTSPTSSFDDLDPFANWPPRPGNSSSGSGTFNNGSVALTMASNSSGLSTSMPKIISSFQNDSNVNWGFNSASSVPLRPNQGDSALNSSSLNGGSLNPQNSIGFLKQNQGISASGSLFNDPQSTDLKSILGSSKNEQIAPKLAPPPLTAVGRGRGRGRGSKSTSRSTQAKPSSQQPPLLDLL